MCFESTKMWHGFERFVCFSPVSWILGILTHNNAILSLLVYGACVINLWVFPFGERRGWP